MKKSGVRSRAPKHIAVAFLLSALAGCGAGPAVGMTGDTARATSGQALSFSDLSGWSSDRQAEALGAFKLSCARILLLDKAAPLDARTGNTRYGRAGDWQPACRAAGMVASGDKAARAFFEQHFRPVRLPASASSLFTGYYEPVMRGSLTRHGPYQTPVLSYPPAFAAARNAGKALPTRSDIEDRLESGALNANRLALVWLADPVDAFFLHVQGSGRVTLDNGGSLRLAFAAKNERPYTSIGKLLIDRGAIPREDVTMQTIRAWLEANPREVRPLLRRNESYIFFRELRADPLLGPPGAEKANLTPRRSLAIDRSQHPLGALFWLDTTYPVPHVEKVAVFRHLMVAQDTGTAIVGLQRGDVFWGHEADAAEIAGRMKQPGELVALLPRTLDR